MTGAPPRGLERPPRLHRGDTVALVAPSSGAPEDRLADGVRAVEEWGLKVRVAPNVTTRPEGTFDFLAGDDRLRAREFERAWLDPEVAAVLCARGGDGANRMVELVDWERLRAAGPKTLAGFSDVTTLHNACARRLGLASLHAPMPLTEAFREHPPSREHLRRTLFDPEAVTELTSPTATTLAPGRARGVTAGGCLSVLAAELGTGPGPGAGLPDPDGTLLLLEDVGENLTHLDRYLGQLLRSGYLGRVAGVVLGSWRDCGDPGRLRELFEDRLRPLGVPVVWEMGFGHATANLTVPLGAAAVLDADAATLTLEQPALR